MLILYCVSIAGVILFLLIWYLLCVVHACKIFAIVIVKTVGLIIMSSTSRIIRSVVSRLIEILVSILTRVCTAVTSTVIKVSSRVVPTPGVRGTCARLSSKNL